MTSAPLGFTVALSVAEVVPSEDAAPVTTTGGLGSVLNVRSAPLLATFPLLLMVASEILKW
jgi:hypothetical protein